MNKRLFKTNNRLFMHILEKSADLNQKLFDEFIQMNKSAGPFDE